VPAGFNDSELDFLLDTVVLPLAAAFAPQAVVVTCGTDALAGDPLSGLALSNVALWDAVERVIGDTCPAVVLGGGGYNPWTLARCWTGLWGRLAGHAIPAGGGAADPARPGVRPGRGRGCRGRVDYHAGRRATSRSGS
jgi:acetoin utilization protein AcuC